MYVKATQTSLHESCATLKFCADAVSVSILRETHPSWQGICHGGGHMTNRGSCDTDHIKRINLRLDFPRILVWPVTLCHHPGGCVLHGTGKMGPTVCFCPVIPIISLLPSAQ